MVSVRGAIAIVACALVVAALTAFKMRHVGFGSSEEKSIRVVSFNLLCDGCDGEPWAARREATINTIVWMAPDILAVQECGFSQQEAIESSTSLKWVAGSEEGPLGLRSGVMIRRGRFLVRRIGRLPILRFDALGAFAVLEDVGGVERRLVAVLSVHLDYDNQHHRVAAVEAIKGWIDEQLPKNCPLLIAGDMNDVADSLPMEKLTADLVDASASVGGTFLTDNRRIDAIVVSHHFVPTYPRIEARAINLPEPSDHRPISVVLKWSTPHGMGQ